MKLHSISLTNFLCYYGNQNRIHFGDGLNLILGANGYGKTKLYDAFQWMFKDGISNESDARSIKRTDLLGKDLISEKALSECRVGEEVNCEVILEISDREEKFQLIRKYSVRKLGKGKWAEKESSTLEILKKDVIDFKPYPATKNNDLLYRLMNDEIMPYVWFQGEKGVNNIIDTSSEKALRRVINKLSDIEKWDQYVDIITEAAKASNNAFERELKAKNRDQQKYEKLIQDRNIVQERIKRKSEELENVQQNLERAKDKQNKIISQLASAEQIYKLRNDRELVAEKLKGINAELNSFQINFTKSMFSEGWLLMGTEKLLELFEKKLEKYNEYVFDRQLIEEVENRSESRNQRLPRGIPERPYVKQMLKQERCLVCDRPAKKGTKEYAAIHNLLDNVNKGITRKPRIDYELSVLNKSCFAIMENSLRAKSEIKEWLDRKDSLIERKEELIKKVELLGSEINTEVENSGVNSATDVISTASNAQRDITTYSNKEGTLFQELENLKTEELKFNSQIEQLSVGNVDPAFLERKEVLDYVKDLVYRVKDQQYLDLVKQLEESANSHYVNINNPTGAFFGKVKFKKLGGGGFLPVNVDDKGQEVSNPNTSQTTSLKLAIILAIMSTNKRREFNKRYPLIADAPISDFDPVKKKSFLVELCKTFEQSVVIVYDFLSPDPIRSNRYRPNEEELKALKTEIEKSNKQMTVHFLDIPDGISTKDRVELSVQIKPINTL